MRIANRYRSPRRHRGIALVWVVVTFVVLLGFIGLALDTARVLLTAHELQTAADAGALAGAQYVREDQSQAMLAARTVAAANTAEKVSITLPDNPSNDAAGYVVLGRFDRDTLTFTATTTAPNAVKVIAARSAAQNGQLPLLFGPIFNASSSTVSRQAIAMVGGGTGAGLIALKGTKTGLTIQGNSILNVNNGAIQVNSTDNKAIVSGGGATINSPEIDVTGNVDNTTSQNYQGDLNPGAAAIPDPLSGLAVVSTKTPNKGSVSVSGGATVNLQPGYYPSGISMNSPSSTLNLAPGIYVIDGTKNSGGLQVNSGTFNAYGVMFSVIGGPVSLTGGTVNITGIDPTTYSYSAGTEVYEGVSIFQSSTSDSTINGNNTLNLGGTLYFRNNVINLSGTSSGVGNQLIANEINISGGANVTINYDGRNNAAGTRVYLVQ